MDPHEAIDREELLVSEDAVNLLRLMVDRHPETRPGTEELLDVSFNY